MGATRSFVIFTFLSFCACICESRVYCQDKNAQTWMRFGYACPVTCTSITDAIKKLKYMDLKKTLRGELGIKKYEDKVATELENNQKLQETYGQMRQSLRNLVRKENTTDNTLHFNVDIKTNKISFEENKEVNIESWNSNDMFLEDIENNEINTKTLPHEEDDRSVTVDNNKLNDIPENKSAVVQNLPYGCWSVGKYDVSDLKIKLKRTFCTRRSNFDERLLRIMTKILNKYIKSPFVFTEDITEVLLEKLFGKNTDLRNNIFDVNNLLKYLRQAITRHSQHTFNQKIVLQSQHCLFMSLPGCYCRPGFVESLGQCVMPIDCVVNEKDRRYLIRIVVQ